MFDLTAVYRISPWTNSGGIQKKINGLETQFCFRLSAVGFQQEGVVLQANPEKGSDHVEEDENVAQRLQTGFYGRSADGCLRPDMLFSLPAQDLICFHTDLRKAEEEQKMMQKRLEQALTRALSGFIPICANCKRIRDEKGEWRQVEAYIHARTEARFSHGICQECGKKLYGDLYEE